MAGDDLEAPLANVTTGNAAEALARKHFKAWAGELTAFIVVKQDRLAVGPEPANGDLRFHRALRAVSITFYAPRGSVLV